MRIESKLEMVVIQVSDLEEATQFYERLFDTKFQLQEARQKEGLVRFGMSPVGLELFESPTKDQESDRLRSILLRVPDVDTAKLEMKTRGFEPVDEVHVGDLREAIYNIRGVRICLIDRRGELS